MGPKRGKAPGAHQPRVLRSVDGYDWSQVLTASTSEGHRMISRLLADFGAGTNRFDLPGEILLAHLVDRTVVAVCGLNREQETAFGRAGRVRRLYVLPARRHQGLASSLLEAIAAFAHDHHEVLTVKAGSPFAGAFFEHMGFQAVSHTSITHISKLVRDRPAGGRTRAVSRSPRPARRPGRPAWNRGVTMPDTRIDLKAQQRAALARPRLTYSPLAWLLLRAMDLVAGKQTTLAKVSLLEMLASIPYREWEVRQYAELTQHYDDDKTVHDASEIMVWARQAQDNEYWHLLLAREKMRQEGLKSPWYLSAPVRMLATLSYVALARLMSHLSIRRALLFNAEFEDHAEHVYARFVADHPEWESQPAASPLVRDYGRAHAKQSGDLASWADVFRRIGLDERDHMNTSALLAGRPDLAVRQE